MLSLHKARFSALLCRSSSAAFPESSLKRSPAEEPFRVCAPMVSAGKSFCSREDSSFLKVSGRGFCEFDVDFLYDVPVYLLVPCQSVKDFGDVDHGFALFLAISL